MEGKNVTNTTKSAVGLSLAGPAGEVCLRTRCQDIIPRLLSGTCKEAGKGRAARQTCRPLLRACLDDEAAAEACVEKCARYFTGDDLPKCQRDCELARCRVVPAYEQCVFQETVRNVLSCIDSSDGRAVAERCVQERCGLKCTDTPLEVKPAG